MVFPNEGRNQTMLNDKIKLLREAGGMTQVGLAKELSVSKQCVSNWENNNIQPSVEMLVAIADFFGVSTDYLLDRENEVRLSVSGLTDNQIQHVSAIIRDIADRSRTTKKEKS